MVMNVFQESCLGSYDGGITFLALVLDLRKKAERVASQKQGHSSLVSIHYCKMI